MADKNYIHKKDEPTSSLCRAHFVSDAFFLCLARSMRSEAILKQNDDKTNMRTNNPTNRMKCTESKKKLNKTENTHILHIFRSVKIEKETERRCKKSERRKLRTGSLTNGKVLCCFNFHSSHLYRKLHNCQWQWLSGAVITTASISTIKRLHKILLFAKRKSFK